MLLTEDEAKEKWCFNVKYDDSYSSVDNKCIASECMAWRWTSFFKDKQGVVRDAGKGIDRAYNEFGGDLRCGYCGLAGKVR